MQNTTEITGLRLTERLGRLLEGRSYAALCLCCGGGGMVAAMARIIGQPAPFGVAFAAAVPFRFTLPTALGVAVGYLASAGVSGGYRYIAASFLVTLIRWLLRPEKWDRWKGWICPFTASSCVLLAGVVPALYRDPLLYDALLWLTQIVIAGAAASFLDRAMAILSGEDCRTRFYATALGVLFAIGVMGLHTIQLGGVTLGRIAAATAVLAAVRVRGNSFAAMAGILSGLAVGFCTGDFPLYVTIYGLGGMLAGIFSVFGRLGSTLAFTFTYGAVSALASRSPSGFIEVTLAAVLFLMIPPTVFRLLAATFTPSAADEATVKCLLEERLTGTAEALREVSDTTREVAKRLARTAGGDLNGIFDRVAERLCKKCPYSMACWQEHYSDTVDALSHSVRKLKNTGSLEGEDLPDSLGRCIRRDQMAALLTAEYTAWTGKEEARRRAARARNLVTDQFDGMAIALEGMVEQLEEIAAGAPALAAHVEEIFREAKLEPKRAVCWKDREGRVTAVAEIPQYKQARAVPEQLAAEIGEALELTMSYPEVARYGANVRYTFRERPLYGVEYGSCQLCSGGGSVCGDSFRLFTTSGGQAHLLLSDGMGTGSAAAVDSAMAASLVTRMLEAGMDYRSALRMVNAALLVKSGEESLATLDAAAIDLYTGKVRLYKAGAAPTILRRSGRGVLVESTSLPAGILERVEFEESSFTLEEGDLLVLLSDGDSAQGCQWILRELEAFRQEDLDSLCQRLARTARLRRTDGREDDITILCCRLTRQL